MAAGASERMGESIGEFMERQRRKLALVGRETEAAAHEAYKKAIRAGQDLNLKSPSDVMRHGAKLLEKYERRTANAVSSVTQKAKAQANAALRSAGQNPVTRSIAIEAARSAGNAAGVVRGAVHAAQGAYDGAKFTQRLLDPLDAAKNPQGVSTAEQLARSAVSAGQMTADYVRNGITDPRSVVRDVSEAGRRWRSELDPSATPAAPTFEGELRRNFDIGKNQGELAFNVGSAVVGGPAAKAMGLPRLSNVGNVERYISQGFGPRAAAHLAEPYPASGMGHHFISRREKLPNSYSDSEFNVLKPRGLSRGDFYELHYRVDPRYYGGGVLDESWSGKQLGLEKYGVVGRLWHGSPAPLKARVGGLGGAGGGAMYVPESEETDW